MSFTGSEDCSIQMGQPVTPRSRAARNGLFAVLALLSGCAHMTPADAQDTPQADAWGEPVEGIQLKLMLSDGPQLAGTASLLPPLQIRFRNQGSRPATYVDAVDMCLGIEVDGVWYMQERCMSGSAPPPTTAIAIPAGGKSDLLSFSVTQAMAASTLQRLELMPGRHTLRVGTAVVDADCGRRVGDISALSCPDGKRGTSIGSLSSNPVSFDFPVRADVADVMVPRCGIDLVRSGNFVVGGVERGETFTQTRGNVVGQPADDGWTLKLVPVESGWQLQVSAAGRESEDISRLTPPWHGPNPRDLFGWHFRNTDNTAQNDGGVNAPGLMREFIFSSHVGRDIQGAAATSSPTSEEIDAVRFFGRGWLFIDSYRLTAPRKGEQAAFESLTFHACLTWPR